MGIFNLDKEDENEKPKTQIKRQSKKGVISSFVGEFIIVDVDGNGERIKFNQKDHGDLKIGDTIVIN